MLLIGIQIAVGVYAIASFFYGIYVIKFKKDTLPGILIILLALLFGVIWSGTLPLPEKEEPIVLNIPAEITPSLDQSITLEKVIEAAKKAQPEEGKFGSHGIYNFPKTGGQLKLINGTTIILSYIIYSAGFGWCEDKSWVDMMKYGFHIAGTGNENANVIVVEKLCSEIRIDEAGKASSDTKIVKVPKTEFRVYVDHEKFDGKELFAMKMRAIALYLLERELDAKP